MSIGSGEASSDSIQVHPGPAAAGSTPSADPEPLPHTPTPPLPSKQQQSALISSQQQQIQHHQQGQLPSPQDASSTSIAPVTTSADPAPSTPATTPPTDQAPQRPPPPASAVSLHAAAAAANRQVGAQSNSTSQLAPSSASNGKTGADSAPKKAAKPKTTKAPGATKPKQKRKANQAGANDEVVYRPALSTAGGTIGAAPDSTIPAMLSAAGGGRKAMPELVLPFQLPFVDVRPEMPMLDNASVQAAMAMGASETSSLDTGSDSDDYSVLSDNSDLDQEAEESRKDARRRKREPATIEESLVLLQSLRQSRLSHLSSLLTPFSQRVRSGMIYPNVLPLSLLHGLNPRDPHVLIQLGRADIHVGPHVFLKTKFWEVRPDYELPPTMNTLGGMHAPGPYATLSVYPRLPVPQPMPQQLPQPQPAKLPLPRAAPSPVAPQPSVPLARPPIAPNKSPVARPATTSTPAATASNATMPATLNPPASRQISLTTSAVLPTPTLPATPMQSSTAVRPVVTLKAAVPAPATPTASTPMVKLPALSAGIASTPTTASATSLSTAPKVSIPVAASPPVSGSTTPTSASSDSKPATSITTSTATPLAPKPMSVSVSLPRPPMTTPSLPRPPSINQNNVPSSVNPATSSSSSAAGSAAPRKALSPVSAASAEQGGTGANANVNATPSAASPLAAKVAAAPSETSTSTNAASATVSSQGSTAAKPAAPTNTNANTASPQAPSRPSGVPPPPAIDAVLVSRVNATAALNPELQELLHIAASGKANPNQLKALGVWIQAITAQLRQDEARNAAAAGNTAAASGSRAGNTASTTAEGKKSKKSKVDEAAKASKKQAKIEEREAKKKAKAEAKAKAQADKQQAQKQQKQKQAHAQPQQTPQQQKTQQTQHQPPVSNKLRHPPPGWPTDGPPKPPVIIVEFRENPSMRFILPLWKCLVERTEGVERPSSPKVKKERRSFFDNDSDDEDSPRIEPELKLSFFAPSLGSDAADGSGLRELEEELKRKAAEEAKLNAASAASTGGQGDAARSSASPEAASAAVASDKAVDDSTSSQEKKKKGGPSDGSSKKGSKATNQASSDASLSSDYSQSKKHEVYPLTWSIKGGVTESLWEAFGRVPGTMTCQPVKREPEIELEPDVAEFLVPEIRYHLLDLPMEEIKIHKETTDTFVDLYSQMPDRRFILPRVAPALLPAGLEDHLHDRFAVRTQCVQDRPIVKRKAGAREDDVSFSYEGIGLTVIGPNGVKTEPGATAPPKPPKRKRHVATHNPDGSIKSCGACGKTKTPMWRRGPKGPSQLCNACGARWKAGRLVVPEVAPAPIIEAEEDKSKEEEARKEDEVQASMHGSNALVIPQSSGADDASYTVMASNGLVGAAAFGDHFSLSSKDESGIDFGASHLSRGSSSPSPFIRSPIPEDDVMPASVDPSMLSGSNRVFSHRR